MSRESVRHYTHIYKNDMELERSRFEEKHFDLHVQRQYGLLNLITIKQNKLMELGVKHKKMRWGKVKANMIHI